MKDESRIENIHSELAKIVGIFGEGNQDGIKEALRLYQGTFGHVSVPHQTEIAQAFKVEDKLVKTIIKFMPSIKESFVENEIVFCSGRRCGKKGSILNLKVIKDELGIGIGETTKDGKIRLNTQSCFKACGQGPNIMVNGKLYSHMDEEKTKKLMRELKKL